MKLPDQVDTYLFAVSTYGGNVGNVIAQIGTQLKRRTWQLHYGATIWAYPNAVIFYPMIKGVGLFSKIASRSIKRIIRKIVAKQQASIPALNESAQKDMRASWHKSIIAIVATT